MLVNCLILFDHFVSASKITLMFKKNKKQRTVKLSRLYLWSISIIIALTLSKKMKAEDSAEIAATMNQISIANARIKSSLNGESKPSPAQVVVIYFTPKDRPPAKNYATRIPRIVDEVASFYHKQLAKQGFHDRELNISRDEQKKVKIITVVGDANDADYGKQDGRRIREETMPFLRTEGIDPDKSVLLIFCNMMDYDADKATIAHHSPYYGGGSYLSGNAWQCDSEILDPLRLDDMTPIQDGEYGRITVGRHNSIFIGGVIHELGHALSLPHCRQRADEATDGTALMGSGNRTYAEERRHEGKGTFLTLAHALRLAAHPALNPRSPASLYDRANTKWHSLKVTSGSESSIQIRGKIESNVPVHGLVAYFDPEGRGDYDATTATAVPDDDGNFSLRSGKLRNSKSGEIRIACCHVNGATSMRKGLMYRVDSTGKADVSRIRILLELQPVLSALRRNDTADATRELRRLVGDDAEMIGVGSTVIDRFTSRNRGAKAKSVNLHSIAPEIESIPLSSVHPETASVGWIRPTYDRVPSKQSLISVAGDYFARGIYAHAPAEHVYKLDAKWDVLAGSCGVQDGNPGLVGFQVIADGRVVWEKQKVVQGKAHDFNINVSGVNRLSLKVTDGGNSNAGDWGIWISPSLKRSK